MKRPLAIIGITYLVSLTFLGLIPNRFTNYLVCLFAVLLFISLIFKKLRKTWVLPLCFATCLVSLAVQIISNNNTSEILKLSGQEHVVSGKIYDIPYKHGNQYEYILRLDSIDQANVKPFLVNLKTDSALEGDIYSTFTGKIRFEMISHSSKMYYNSKNIFILGKLNKNQSYKTKEPTEKDPYYYILKIRQKILSTPREFLNPEISAVISAIFIGEKNNLPENTKKDFQTIGVYHLLATSGMHVAIISGFIFYILKKLKIKEKQSALISAFSMLLFMALAGFTPSVTRASLMAAIYFFGMLISRKPDPLNSLGISVLIICAVNPFASCDIGLWLSFLATLGIILCYSPIKNYIEKKINVKKNSLSEYIISTISVTTCAFIFTLPIVILKFKKISPVSPISNLIFIPCINMIINLSAFANLLGILNVPRIITKPLFIICGHITHTLIKISEFMASFPYAAVSLKYQAAYIWLIITLVLTAITIMIKPTPKAFTKTALLSLNTALICVFAHQVSNYNTLDISFVPCQDGICATLAKNNHLSAIACISDDSEIENINDAISDSYIKDLDYLNLSVGKNTDENIKNIENLIGKHPPSNMTLNSDSPIKFDTTDGDCTVTYYKSDIKTTFWDNLTITTLKIENHTYLKIETPDVSFILFPNGGNAEKLPKDWKSCDILVANGLPLNYSCLNFEQAIISSNSKDSLINTLKLSKQNKKAIALYNLEELHIKVNSAYKEKYKIGRLS